MSRKGIFQSTDVDLYNYVQCWVTVIKQFVYGMDGLLIIQIPSLSPFVGSGSQNRFSYYTSVFELCHEKMGLRTYANSKASGDPAHPSSLARRFAVCLNSIKVYFL